MDIAFIAYIVYWGLAVLASVFVLTDNKRPSEVNLLWLFILLFVPFFGLLIYIIFGVNLKRKTIFSILAEDRLRRRYRNRLDAQKKWLDVIPSMSNEGLAEKLKIKNDPEGSSNLLQSVAGIARDSDCFKTVHMLLDTCGAPLAANVSTTLFFTGPEAFDSLIADLKAARESVDMEFYIWHSDRTGKEILAILEERARAGVRIRLIFDSIGCWGKISLSYRRKLKAAGIRFHYFLDPLSYIGHRQINFRSHRKIAVIDERVCYTGGMNIGDEYRFPAPDKWYKTWRDTMVRLEGDSAAYMQDIFEIDWHNSDRKELKQPSVSESDFPEETTDDVFASLMPGEEERSLAQIICSGPDSSFDAIELLYSSLIANANRYVCIQSPYFIPSDNVLKSLQTAALSGVQIQIITTARKLVGLCRELDPTRPVTSALCAWDSDWEIYDPLAEAFDIVGYNYMMYKHEGDHIRVPERIMIQTESYPRDAFQSWSYVNDNPYIIGDFVWTSVDYLGESSIGRWYYEGENAGEHFFGDHFPWNAAYCGDIDMIGQRKPISYYRERLWNYNRPIYMAVKEPNGYYGNIKETMWSVWPTFESWTWPGHEGKEIEVEVYSRAPRVRLTLNGKVVGEKPTTRQEEFKAVFKVIYEPGTILAEAINNEGDVLSELNGYHNELKTAGEPYAIRLKADRSTINPDGQDLSFITAEVVDKDGIVCPDATNLLTFSLKGRGTLLAVGNADIKELDTTSDSKHKAWKGKALAVVRSQLKKGKAIIAVSSQGLKGTQLEIRCK